MNLKKYIPWFKKHDWKILIFLILASVILQYRPTKTATNNTEDFIEIDTIIPNGYALFPLDLMNKKSIDSMLGAFGVVDLYQYLNSKNKKLLMANIKIFRAPKNPEQFYILVPEHHSNIFIQKDQKTFAVIKNRSQKTRIKQRKKKNELLLLEIFMKNWFYC